MAWWSAFGLAYAAALADAGDPDVVGISVAGQQHGMVTLDANGDVLRPAKLWNDTESTADAGWLCKQLPGGAAEWAAAVVSVPVAAFTITKLSWLYRTDPDAWVRLAHVLLPHDWLTYRMTGELVGDRGDASGTGYWSPLTGDYRWDLLKLVDGNRDWSQTVPRIAGPTEVVGEWNGIPVACGTGDNMGAALGLGLTAGTAVISIGTSGTAYAVSTMPSADPSGLVAGFADASGRYLPLACTLNATKVTDAVARLLGAGREELEALALAAPSGADGLTLLPYFDGERTPNLPGATGWMSGLRSDVSREQVARAAVEGVCCSTHSTHSTHSTRFGRSRPFCESCWWVVALGRSRIERCLRRCATCRSTPRRLTRQLRLEHVCRQRPPRWGSRTMRSDSGGVLERCGQLNALPLTWPLTWPLTCAPSTQNFAASPIHRDN